MKNPAFIIKFICYLAIASLSTGAFFYHKQNTPRLQFKVAHASLGSSVCALSTDLCASVTIDILQVFKVDMPAGKNLVQPVIVNIVTNPYDWGGNLNYTIYCDDTDANNTIQKPNAGKTLSVTCNYTSVSDVTKNIKVHVELDNPASGFNTTAERSQSVAIPKTITIDCANGVGTTRTPGSGTSANYGEGSGSF